LSKLKPFSLLSFSRQDLARFCLQIESEGLFEIDSGKPGPVVGILAHTHGNEPVGLAAIMGLLAENALADRLKVGKVLLIVNNLEAARRFYREAEGQTTTAAWRFVDQDMNRVPEVLAGESYELQRLRQVLPYYQSLTHVLDLHSTSAPSEPMLIQSENAPDLSFPGVSIQLQGIIACLRGKPLISLCKQAAGYVVECGSHENPESWRLAQAVSWHFLAELGLLDGPVVLSEQDLETYEIYQAVVFPNASYQLTKILESYEFLPQGMVLARGEGEPLVIKQDSYAIMPSPRLRPVHSGSEFLFLATRKERL